MPPAPRHATYSSDSAAARPGERRPAAAVERGQIVRRARPPQVSIAFMLLSMTILCAMSAAMFYASRVPAIYNEVFSWFGKEVEPAEGSRTVHLTFLLFTYSSPLLLAGLLGVVVSVLRWFSPEPGAYAGDHSSPWDDEDD